MKYRTGRAGRIVLARFDDGDDVLGGLASIAKDEDIRAATVHLVGGMKRGRFVVGPESEEMPPRPLWRDLGESHEIVGVGTIFFEGETPRVHLHGAFGKRDEVKVGCLRADTQAFIVLEAVITEITDIEAVREKDPVTGMALLKL
jgi:predicted DNA-binding protein with PD1-like motif